MVTSTSEVPVPLNKLRGGLTSATVALSTVQWFKSDDVSIT